MTRILDANRAGSIARLALVSVSYLVLNGIGTLPGAQAQTATGQGASSSLPPVTVTAPETKRRPSGASGPRSNSAARSRRTQTARRPEAVPATKPFAETHDARTGTAGYYANSTSVGTKTNTALHQPAAIGVGADQGFHPGPEHPQPHRPDALRAGCCDPSGRRQPRRTRDPRRRFQRQLLRQRFSRRRAVLPRHLQRPERRSAEGPGGAGVRTRRRRRRGQPHAQGSRRQPDL